MKTRTIVMIAAGLAAYWLWKRPAALSGLDGKRKKKLKGAAKLVPMAFEAMGIASNMIDAMMMNYGYASPYQAWVVDAQVNAAIARAEAAATLADQQTAAALHESKDVLRQKWDTVLEGAPR